MWESSKSKQHPGPPNHVFMERRCLRVFVFLWGLATLYLLSGLSNSSFTPSSLLKDSDGFPKILKLWGPFSPYSPAGAYLPPPPSCHVTQVNILQRHGARFPEAAQDIVIRPSLAKLQLVKNFTDPRFKFISNFTYDLGTEDLIPFGAQQSFVSGEEHFMRYEHLVSTQNLPFVRASSSQRVVDSANNWTAGFAIASGQIFKPKLSVILSETGNDTLDHSMCPNAGNSDAQKEKWISTFGPAVAARINAAAPGANIVADDVYNIMLLCPFESVAKEKQSPFCNIFSKEDWENFEYVGDLDKYYRTGYGQALGRVQGVGYVNELLARLTSTPVKDKTQTNRTLDSSPITFPLNRTIYVDFSHEHPIISIISAMGLFEFSKNHPPKPKSPDPKREWIASKLVPFSARVLVEKVQCSGAQKGEFVRVFVNDALQKMGFCGSDKFGLCTLKKFVKSQSYARNNGKGDFEKCFSKHSGDQ